MISSWKVDLSNTARSNPPTRRICWPCGRTPPSPLSSIPRRRVSKTRLPGFQRITEDETDCSFALERRASGIFEGGVSIYTIRAKSGTGPGCVRPNGAAGSCGQARPRPWSAPFSFIALAFERLGLDEVYCRTVQRNASVVSFHTSFGAADAPRAAGLCGAERRPHDSVEQVMTANRWAAIAPGIESKVERLGALLSRSAASALASHRSAA